MNEVVKKHVNELFSTKGKVALVIGGGGKIGFPMAEALAEAGATVYIGSRNEITYSKAVNDLIQKDLDVEGIFIDISDENSIQATLKKIKNRHGQIDILINSSSFRPMKKFMHDSWENWDSSMSTNARGLFLTCKIFGEDMAKNGSGSIINISSIYGLVAPDMSIYEGCDFETEPDYPFIKGGTIMFSKYLASYFAKKGVRVNVICPGGFYNNQDEPFLSNYISKTPLGRMAVHNDMKGAALFLSSEASSYITGSVIPVDGGWTIT